MSTLTKDVPAHIAARIQQRQESGAKSAVAGAIIGDGISYPRISTRASNYRLVEGGVETVVGQTLNVVIIGANPKVSKQYYDKPFSGEAEAPACFSDDGVKPDPTIENPVHDTCAGCPHNELGSKITPSGHKSKMCADQRHLAVLCAADPTKVYGLTVPVSGMKALREYFKELANYGLAPEEVVTELGFDSDASFPKITFSHKSYVPEKVISLVDEISQHETVQIATRQVPMSMRLAGPSSPTPQASTESYEEPEPAPEPEPEPEPEPVKAKKEKPTVEPVAPSDELADKIANLFD
jgi:hypothetical protein